MQAIGQRSAAPYTGFDAVTPPPAPAAPPEAISHVAPAEQPHQDGAPAPQPHSFNNKGPLRVADTARPARQIPDWVPGQPPALAGLNTAQPAARLEPSEGRLRTPGGLASLMSAGTPLSALQNLPLPLTPIAAAATKAATPADPATPAAPKADPMEIAALELLLAEPENQDMIRHFGGELKPLPTWTTVGQGIEARYGQDLGSRLYQLQNAQRAVEAEFFQAMDAARQAELPRLPQHPMSMRRNEPAPESGVPGWVYNKPGDGHFDGSGPSWEFDPAAFARHYARGDSPAQRAFAHLHGPEAVRFVPAPNTEGGGASSWSLNGRTLVLGRKIDDEEGLTSDSLAASQNGTPDWAPSRVLRPDTQLDPDRITKLHNKEFVWFDPQLGWSTDEANIKQSGLDRAFPYIFAGAITAMTFGAGSTVAAGISSAAGGGTAGNLAVAAATGAVSNAALQLAANGKINFGQLLQSALSAGATAGIAHLPGVGQHLDGLAGTAAQRLMEYTGRASVQGALQAIMGGNFRDGMANSLLGSLAGEVGQQLNAHINQLQVTHGLNASEASALRLLSRAASSALRVAGSGDAAAGFASDFLGGIMGDALQEHPGTSRTEPQDPLGEFIADNEQAWAERQAAYDQIEAAFSHRPATDRSQDVIVAAGPEYTGLGENGLGADGVYRVTITGTGASAAAQELERIDQLLQSASGTGVSRAGLYNDLVVDRFRELSAGDQRTILAALDDYANALHDTNALVRSGLAPGSLEARRADLAVRIAADFARQSGAIPVNARFPADARVGMETGLATIIGAVAGRGRANEVGYGPPRQGLEIPQGLSPAAFDRISGTVRGAVDRMGLGDDVFVMGSRAGGTASAGSDLDIGIRVPSAQFNSLVNVYFSGARNSRAETMRYAIRDGRIQAGEAGLSRLSRQVASQLGMPNGNVQISIIRAGGVFDNGPQSPLSFTLKK